MDQDSRLQKLEEDVRRLSARESIWQLMARYAKAVDEEDDQELNAIFSEDATCETVPWSQGKVFEGRASIVRLFNGYQRTFKNRKRFITNEIIDITGETSATAWSNWLVVHAKDDESYIGWGCYDWGFICVADTWLISSFVVRVERMTPLQEGWAGSELLLKSFPGN